MNDEMLDKINELLRSRDKGEVELGLRMVRNHIRDTHPCNVHLEKGKDYIVTRLEEKENPPRIWRTTLRCFERRVHHWDGNPMTRRHMLRFAFMDVESRNVLAIAPPRV